MSPRASSSSSNSQSVATRRPRAGPAACRSPAPWHTLVTQSIRVATFWIQLVTVGLFTSRRVPAPPGTSRTSSGGWLSRVWSGMTRNPLLQRTGSVPSAIVTTVSTLVFSPARTAADAVKTSQGPTKSSSSAFSKIKSPNVVMPSPISRWSGESWLWVVGRADAGQAISSTVRSMSQCGTSAWPGVSVTRGTYRNIAQLGDDAGIRDHRTNKAVVADQAPASWWRSGGGWGRGGVRALVLGDDVPRAVEFWGQALGYVPRDEVEDDWAVMVPGGGPGTRLALQLSETPVQEHPRIHLDLYAGDAADQAAEVERLVGLGAKRVDWHLYPDDPDFVVLADPDGYRNAGLLGDGALVGPHGQRGADGDDPHDPDDRVRHRVSDRPRVAGCRRCVGIAELHPHGVGQRRHRVPLGDRAQHPGHGLGGDERAGHERDREQRHERDAGYPLGCGHQAAKQHPHPDHGEGEPDQQQEAADRIGDAVADPPTDHQPADRHERDRQEGLDQVGDGMAPEHRTLGDGQRAEPVDSLVLAVVGQRQRHPECGEHDRLGEDATHQELAVVTAAGHVDGAAEHVGEQQREHDRLNRGVAQLLGLALHVDQPAPGDDRGVVQHAPGRVDGADALPVGGRGRGTGRGGRVNGGAHRLASGSPISDRRCAARGALR